MAATPYILCQVLVCKRIRRFDDKNRGLEKDTIATKKTCKKKSKGYISSKNILVVTALLLYGLIMVAFLAFAYPIVLFVPNLIKGMNIHIVLKSIMSLIWGLLVLTYCVSMPYILYHEVKDAILQKEPYRIVP